MKKINSSTFNFTKELYSYLQINLCLIISNFPFIGCLFLFRLSVNHFWFYLTPTLLLVVSLRAAGFCLRDIQKKEDSRMIRNFFIYYRQNFFYCLKFTGLFLPVFVVLFINLMIAMDHKEVSFMILPLWITAFFMLTGFMHLVLKQDQVKTTAKIVQKLLSYGYKHLWTTIKNLCLFVGFGIAVLIKPILTIVLLASFFLLLMLKNDSRSRTLPHEQEKME